MAKRKARRVSAAAKRPAPADAHRRVPARTKRAAADSKTSRRPASKKRGAGGRRQGAGGRRQEALGRKQKAGGMAVAILAAGKGTRLKSRHPKVLHEAGGRALLAHVIAAARRLVAARHIYCIVGHEAERVEDAVRQTGVRFVRQRRQLGTGHALQSAQEALAGYEHVLVLSGDVPRIRPETLSRLQRFHLRQRAAMTILTAEPADPAGYGRIVRKDGDRVAAIVEQGALKGAQREVREINSGIYAFRTRALVAHIGRLGNKNAKREFYLTDLAAILDRAGERVAAVRAEDAAEVLGVNTRSELAALDSLLRGARCRELMDSGVTILRPETCVIDADVKVGIDTVVEPFAQLLAGTRVGRDCRIGSYSILTRSRLGDGVHVRPGCVLEEARVSAGAVLGPYAHLRPGSDIGEGAHVGNFVETKKTRLGKGSKANHLSYLGDALVGDGVNVGAGTITCNYDGINKHGTVIEDGAFIGSDATLVAPVLIGKGAYVGAGSSITEDVPADALAIARAHQVVKPGWAKRRRGK